MSAPSGAVLRIPSGSQPLEVGSKGVCSSAAAELAGSMSSSGTAEAAASGKQTGACQESGSAAAALAAAGDVQPGAELKGAEPEAHAALGGDASGAPAALQDGNIPGGRPPTAVSDAGDEASAQCPGERNAGSWPGSLPVYKDSPCVCLSTCQRHAGEMTDQADSWPGCSACSAG